MKKLFAFLLSILFAVSLFGCNSSGKTSGSDADSSSGKEDHHAADLHIEMDKNSVVDYLVKDGTSDYKIVQPRGSAASSAQYAASEMQSYIKKISGVELEIITDANADLNGKYISIGKTALLNAAGIDVDYGGLNGDGFIVKSVNKCLIINGASVRGTIYGVYDYLERAMGVKFISTDVTVIPASEDVPLYETDIVDAPDFELRNYYTYETKDDPVFYTQMRMACPEVNITARMGGNVPWYNRFNTVHNAFYWVADSYLDSHPEFYARNAMNVVYKSTTPALGSSYSGSNGYAQQLCLTNGMTEEGKLDKTKEISVAKLALESLKSFILDDAKAEVFFFGHNDWQVTCQCNDCKKAEGAHGGAAGILVRFINMLSDEIKQWMKDEGINRDITLATWAYLKTEEAPVKKVNGKYVPFDETVIPRDNVAIRTAPIFLDWFYSMLDEKQIQKHSDEALILEKWSALTSNLMIWTYEDSFAAYQWYCPMMRKWGENQRYFKEKGLSYVMLQDNYSGYGSWQADMRTYVGSKVLWHVDADLDALTDEFVEYYFGSAAAPYIKQMMTKFNERDEWLSENVSNFTLYTWTGKPVSWDITQWYSKSFMEECMSFVETARQQMLADGSVPANMKEIYKKHLASAAATPEYMVLSNYSAYYGDEGKNEFARKYFAHCDEAGVLRIAENTFLSEYKSSLGMGN